MIFMILLMYVDEDGGGGGSGDAHAWLLFFGAVAS